MKITLSAAAAATGSTSPSRTSEKRFHLFSVDRTHQWPVQGWSSGDESPLELDEQLVAEEGAHAFALDKESRWPLQGWCQPHKPYDNISAAIDSSAISSRPSVPSCWPQGF